MFAGYMFMPATPAARLHQLLVIQATALRTARLYGTAATWVHRLQGDAAARCGKYSLPRQALQLHAPPGYTQLGCVQSGCVQSGYEVRRCALRRHAGATRLRWQQGFASYGHMPATAEHRLQAKDFEQAMPRRNRLAEPGELAASIAHEIRNPRYALPRP